MVKKSENVAKLWPPIHRLEYGSGKVSWQVAYQINPESLAPVVGVGEKGQERAISDQNGSVGAVIGWRVDHPVRSLVGQRCGIVRDPVSWRTPPACVSWTPYGASG
jgi:hypothetical protein